MTTHAKLEEAMVNVPVDQIVVRQGVATFRRGFFYTNGGSAEQFAYRCETALQRAGIAHEVVDRGEVWKPFRGAAKLANQSHWFVKVVLK